MCVVLFFFSSRRRHTRCALVTGVQTCALPICWRDGLFISGWDGRGNAAFGRRVADLVAVEAMVSDEIRCSTGERLQRVMAALESRSVPVESLHVFDSEPSFPLAWRRLLRSEEHTSELPYLMRQSYAVFCMKKN